MERVEPKPEIVEQEGKPTTGRSVLDRMICKLADDSMAAAYVCLKLSEDTAFGNKLKAVFEAKLQPYLEGKCPPGVDVEMDVLPTTQWLSFWAGVANIDASKAGAKLEDAESEAEDSVHRVEQTRLDDLWRAISAWKAPYKKRLLDLTLARVCEVTDKASRIASMEGRIREIYDNLDDKTKAMVGILEDIAALDGVGVDVEFGQDILYTKLHDHALIKKVCKEQADDPDIACLAEAFELAAFILEEED